MGSRFSPCYSPRGSVDLSTAGSGEGLLRKQRQQQVSITHGFTARTFPSSDAPVDPYSSGQRGSNQLMKKSITCAGRRNREVTPQSSEWVINICVGLRERGCNRMYDFNEGLHVLLLFNSREQSLEWHCAYPTILTVMLMHKHHFWIRLGAWWSHGMIMRNIYIYNYMVYTITIRIYEFYIQVCVQTLLLNGNFV